MTSTTMGPAMPQASRKAFMAGSLGIAFLKSGRVRCRRVLGKRGDAGNDRPSIKARGRPASQILLSEMRRCATRAGAMVGGRKAHAWRFTQQISNGEEARPGL